MTDKDIPTIGLGLRWEDTPAGFRFRTIGRTVTEADITIFAGVTGMVEVLFTNLEYLREQSLFDKRLVPGALVYSFAEGLLMQAAVQGTGLAVLGMELEVLRPTFAGDTITVEVEVLGSRAARPQPPRALDNTPTNLRYGVR